VQNLKTSGEILLGGKDDSCSPRTILDYGREKKALYDQRREECMRRKNQRMTQVKMFIHF